MKKITLFLIMLGFCLTATAQYSFPTVTGPTNVVEGSPVTLSLNDVANTAGVPAGASGSYSSFSITVDWSAGAGGPWASEADLTITTTAGALTLEPTEGGANSSSDTVLTFTGDFPAIYAPTSDGYLDLTLSQSYSGSDADWSNIVVTLFESPTCVIPTGMATTLVTTTSIDLEWSAGFSETTWNLEYKTENFVPGTGDADNTIVVTGTPEASLTGLTEYTNYFIYYQADCGTEDGTSEWVGPFTTLTGYCESVPSSNDYTGISQIELGEETLTSGGDLTYEDFTATTVDVQAQVTANLQITFATYFSYYTNVWIDLNNDLSFDNETELFFQGESETATTYTLNASFLVPDVPLGVYNMRIGTADSGQATPNPCYSGSYGVTIDARINITAAPTCIPPSALTATEITSESAELSWDQVGTVSQWNVEVVESGVTPTGTPTATNISNPYTATGLTGLTTYDYYVQANCGTELSSWAGPFSFTTPCGAYTPYYLEDFADVTFSIAPECWEEADAGDATTGPQNFGAGSWTADGFLNNGFTGAYSINLYSTNKSDWILSPQFDLTGGPFQVEFDFGIMDYASSTVAGILGSDDTVDFFISTDGGTTWTSLLSYDNTSVVSADGIHPVVDLTAYSGQTVQFAFYASEGTVNDPEDVQVFVDNFEVRDIPSCPEPNDLVVSNVTATEAEVSWVEAGTSTVWNIEVVAAGDTPTGTPTATNVSNPYVLTGLDAITSYDVYVQADCSGDLSMYTGPASFTTECDIFVPDYIQTFSTIIPDCWEVADGGDPTTGPTDFGTSSWGADGFLNDGTSGSYEINLWVATKSDWIISPQFDLTGGPFQVEFDFGVMQYASTTTPGTLGSDDVVQLVMTTDNGATWTVLVTYDNTSVFTINGDHPVVDLTAYSGQTAQFAIYASEGTVNDSEDNQVFVDNFRVRGIPTCPEPADLTATNLSLTSTELGWTETGSSSAWNIQYGEAGFLLGDGTTISDITTNPYVLTDLEPDTSYEFYVQSVCSTDDISSFFGPYEFYTGYCESIPTSNTGSGVDSVTLAYTDFTSEGDVNYESHLTPVVDVFQGIDTNLEIVFGHTSTYYTSVWIDFNDDLVFDDTEMVFDGESEGADFSDTSHVLDASFLMPITAAIGEHRLRIGTTNFSTPTPCYNGSSGVTLDFMVNIQALACTVAEAAYTIVPDCDNDQFSIAVDLTSVGDADTLEISNSVNTDTEQVSTTGNYTVGPFDFGTLVKVYITNEQDTDCKISSENLIMVACPPTNDDPCDATVAFVNDDILCVQSTPGTLFGASASNVADPSCSPNADDDVWFQFTATNPYQLISLTNLAGSNTTDIDYTLYEGTCDGLTEIACTSGFALLSSVTPELTVGSTYYIRVFSGGTENETTTFDLCITPYVAPANLTCDLADNYCSGSDATDILYTYNTIGVEPGDGTIDCLYTTPNPTYSVLEIGTSGDILIEMVQNTAFDSNDNPIGDELDVDFILWGPFAPGDDLCDLSAVVDCSYSAAAIENVTLTDAVQGEIYLLLITNYEKEPGVIQVRQTNIGGAGAGSTIADITASLVSDDVYIDPNNDPTETDEVSLCGYSSIVIETYSPFADDFVWTKDGVEITGANATDLTVTESGTYQVLAFDSQCNSSALSQEVIINLYDAAPAVEPQELIACDGPEADGSEVFDLDALTASLALDGYTVTYYLTTNDANQAINAVTSPYTSTGEVLVMRIEDTEAYNNGYLGCREISEVSLIVNPRPEINQPEDFIVCDDLDGVVDGSTEFDLVSIDDEVTTDPNMVMSYHTSLDDAEAGTNPLASPYASSGETVYVRAEDSVTGCYETTSFNLVINLVPLASVDSSFNNIVCPNATVPVTIGITPDNFTESEVTVTWEYNGTSTPGTGLILDTVLLPGDYTAIIEFNNSGCTNTVDIEVEEAESCIFPEGISPNNDGKNDTFDLSSFDVSKLEIFNRYGTRVYFKNNYTNEWHGQTDDGEELPVGTYFYTVIYEGGTKSKSAWVYINR
ncbi:GEVED domain-containing protein [Winogradskyella rapida]|uniref:GEVED domain-containing protein n=1 Tax=Winogradskyella rapida TaxID=549701 RepID=A0ABW3KW47_9FLAO